MKEIIHIPDEGFLTPREEFENQFGVITADQWQWLKEFCNKELAPDKEVLVKKIKEHRPSGFVNTKDGWVECDCGERIPCKLDSDGYALDWEAEHLARSEHLADALLEALYPYRKTS